MFKRNITARHALLITGVLLTSLLSASCNSDKPHGDSPTKAPVTGAPDSSVTSRPEFTVTVGPTASPTPFVSTGPLSVPVFSTAGGFYDAAFSLSLSTTGTHPIYYTLDGSDPRTSDTALLYEAPISIYNNTSEPNHYSALTDITISEFTAPAEPVDKGIILRAVSKSTAGEYSEVVTQSYFVGKTASYYDTMKVVSLVTDGAYLFDPDTGAYMVGTEYHEWVNSEDYAEYSERDTHNPTNYNKDGRESEFPATVQVFEDGTLAYTADVGARISGNWSRASAQKSLRLYARKEYGDGKMRYAFFDELTDASGALLQNFDKVTIRNSGNDTQTLHMRDALIQNLISDLAPDNMAAEPCILFIDGEFWGFYFLREKPDGDYIEARYGIPKEDVTLIKNGLLDSGSEEAYEEYRSFCSWVALADMTLEENYLRFCEAVDVQGFMDYIAAETYVNNADWANGGLNNWIVWRSETADPSLPKADRKWRFIFYDMDMSAGLYHSEFTSYEFDSINTIHAPASDFNYPDMLRSLIKNPVFRELFYANYLYIIDTCFAPNVVNQKITEYHELCGEAILDTFYRFDLADAAANYTAELAHLRNYFNTRPAYAKKYLTAFYKIAAEEQKNLLPGVTFWTFHGPASYLADATNYSFQVSVTETTETADGIQSQANNLTLEPLVPYKLTFQASCTAKAELELGVNRLDGTEYPSCFWTTIELTPEPKEYSFAVLTDKERYTDWRLCFNFGAAVGDYTLQNVRLEKLE